jgi:hypothetical protein
LSIFYFYNIFIFIPFIIFFLFSWFFFLKNNFFSLRISNNNTDILKNSKIFKKVHYTFFINWFLILVVNVNLCLFFLKFDFCLFWFNHLKLNNFIYYVLHFILILNFFLFICIKFYNNSNINYNIDYFFSLFNIGLFVIILYYSNTLYSFIFILEVISILILYKFSVSRYFFKNNIFYRNNNLFENNLPRPFLNLIFFQYWVNFFSTTLMLFFIFNIIYIYGSSEWFFINFLNIFNFNLLYSNSNMNYIFLWFLFFFAFLLKIGFTPIHFFKIEVYKGMPFISIFYYTTYYFFSFFFYFTILILLNFSNYKIYWFFFLLIFIVLGLFYLIILMFDINLIKSFFAYSTIINALMFFLIIFTALN